jgi:hypothetical protein
VPAAGYTKIQDYVSFSNWVGYSYGDPLLKGVIIERFIHALGIDLINRY